MASKLRSKPRVVDTNDVKQKTSLSVQGKICLVLFHGFFFFFLRHLCRVNELVNDQTPITAGHPLHPFIT